ncbi:MAG TPA: Gfo/Idh/MocA family oxidoreductase [Thermodesulfobacteriota bacterium]|jgi:predicted dehydrogenase|nr:Gfo/Idh/MocA family oxidoreductase [Thermodesulfobacteriota bacterium]
MKISIIGAGRARNGIGEYIGKYFHQLGGKVTSVLGTTEKTSHQASSALRKYGIEARPYTDFEEMVGRERPDAVAIASPSSTHYEYLLKSLDSGIHIFCEKPFIWDDHTDILERVEDVLKKASQKKLTVAMNSQWPFSKEGYERLCGKLELRRSNAFFIRMSPFSPGKAMIPESLPHPLSLLYCLLRPGKIEDVSFESRGEGEMDIRFTYLFETKACDVAIRLVHQKTPPREFSFGFNDKIVVRSLDLQNYEIYFNYKDKKLMIRDPLELSVKNFMEAVEKKIEPLVGTRHIIHNMSLLKEINDSFREFGKRNLWKS